MVLFKYLYIFNPLKKYGWMVYSRNDVGKSKIDSNVILIGANIAINLYICHFYSGNTALIPQ